MKIVTDETLGRVATKQWELYRRVKEGTLDASVVLSTLQGLIQNETALFDIEKLDWTVGTQVYEVEVRQDTDFVTMVKNFGFTWGHGNSNTTRFVLNGGIPKKKSVKCRLRLAKVPTTTLRGVLQVYSKQSGFELATSWELLAFIKQSSITRVIKRSTNFIALGDYGEIHWSDNSNGSKPSYAHVCVSDSGNNWSFDHCGFEGTVDRLIREAKVQSYHYILLKEKGK